MLLRILLSGLAIGLVLVGALQCPGQIDFDREVKPILSDRCYICHGPDAEKRAADLRLDTEDGAAYVLSPGEPDESELLSRIESDDEDYIMPPPDSNLSLTKEEIKTVRQWIAEGAKWEQHWSFVAPSQQTPPDIRDPSQANNPIDRFIVARLESEGLSPAPLVNKEKLIRRVSFDLTGLPPTLGETDQFLADDSDDAYSKLVARLLESPRYGERMASDWLDVARYSDTYGYQVDRDRFVWPWRDWVVRSFNQNMPYDQFVVEQLAGDLLPNPTDDQILATTFNRLHPQKVEGGSVEEEFRVEYVADRSQTVGMALMGLTVECCRCHDHKYDPLSQREYYELFAFFNNVDESGLYSYFDPEAIPSPSMLLMKDKEKRTLAGLRSDLAGSQAELNKASQALDDEFRQWIADSDSRQKIEGADLIPGRVFEIDFLDTEISRNELVNDDESKPFVKLTGDDEIKLEAGKFHRWEAFSIETRIKIPAFESNEPIERNVIFHRTRAWTDSASRGYQLLIEDGRLKASLIHFWPGNAISVRTKALVATDTWINVAMTYDGSSRASGLKVYVDGELQQLDMVRDGLQKSIIGKQADHLVIGARFRDRGFSGGKMSGFQVFDSELTPIEVAQLSDEASLTSALEQTADQLDETKTAMLRDYYLANHSEVCETVATKLTEQRAAVSQFVDGRKEIMVMQESPVPRQAYVLARGAYDARTDRVSPGTPAILPALKQRSDAPADRLDLANWLTSGQHPLTSRVAVNRLWQLCFGQGLVTTPEDFGSQGAAPTHPELLDWLALDFQQDWNIKRMLKLIVSSRVYQQSTVASKELLELDPDNMLLARAPTYRLPAEMLRDNVLHVSGLLVEKRGGAPVRPYEVAAAFKPAVPDKGEGLYRRSLYTYWKRTGPAPVMLTLDAAKRDVCQVKRERTSSPLQALVLLNGPQFIEAGRKLSESLIAKHDTSGDDQSSASAIATDLFRSMTSRRPTEKELQIIELLYRQELASFQANEEDAKKLLDIGDDKSETDRPAELAAWTAVANTLMSFDECVMKR